MEKLDYHDFWDIFVNEYLPEKISDEWMTNNENFIEESVNSVYRIYEKSYVDYKILMKLLSEVLVLSFTHFKEYNVF